MKFFNKMGLFFKNLNGPFLLKLRNVKRRILLYEEGDVRMLDYIWLDDKSPILSQLPNNFKSAAILLHPFIQMPFGWGKNKRVKKCTSTGARV